jgi:hypothetical protein
MHFLGWHQGDPALTLTPFASAAGKLAHADKNEEGKSLLALRNNEKLHHEKDELGRSVQGVKNAAAAHAIKDERGCSVLGVSNGKRWAKNHAKRCGEKSALTLWEDPDHPEIGRHNAGNLTQKQKSLGLPHGKENRRRVYP